MDIYQKQLMPPDYSIRMSLDDIDGEVWLPVLGYEGLYEISNFGRAKSLPKFIKNKDGSIRPYRGFCKILKQQMSSVGYKTVTLYKNKDDKTLSIHRLVATMFISNPENKREVNHIYFKKLYNCVYNLEWATRQENASHAITTHLITTKLSISIINSIRNETELTRIEISKKYNIFKGTINAILRGHVGNHYKQGEKMDTLKLRHGATKFSKDVALEIIEMYKNGLNYSQIGRIMDCHGITVKNIIIGKSKSYFN